MGQTLYAIAALMAATSFSYTVLQRQVHMQRQSIAREVEEMAAAVALETLEVIRSRTFDQAEAFCEEGDEKNCKLKGESNDVKHFTYYKNSDHFRSRSKFNDSEGKACHSSAAWWDKDYGQWIDPSWGGKYWWAEDCNDIDDYHKMKPATIKMPMGDDDGVIEFHVEVEVEYVAPMKAGSQAFVRKSQKTAYKQVTVKVWDSWGDSEDKKGIYIPEPVTLSRVMAYDYNPTG